MRKKEDTGRNHAAMILGLVLFAATGIVILVSLMTQAIVLGESAGSNAFDWDVVFTENFESGISASWVVTDLNGTMDGEYYWATTAVTASQGISSVWATGGGANGALLTPGSDNYPASAVSSMMRQSVNVSGTTALRLHFDYWLDVADNIDVLQVQVSPDGGASFDVVDAINEDSDGWQTRMVDLTEYAGAEDLQVGFLFSSNAINQAKGAFVDNVRLESMTVEAQYLPVMRLDPTPTPTATPVPDDYLDDFNGPGTGWLMRRTDIADNSDWRISYADGRLLLDIESANDYLLVSPLREAPPPPYYLRGRFDFRGDKVYDMHSYGIVFGGDWNGQPCPATNFSSCFNSYYWLHARFRETGTNDKLELQLKHVTGHTSNNLPIFDVIWGWVAPDDFDGVDVAADDWTTWRVDIESDGDLEIWANNVRVKTIQSTDIPNLLQNVQNNPYFGIIQHVASSGDSTIQVDYFEVTKE